MKSSSISLLYQTEDEGDASTNDYLINLIDCPGHVDFSVEVSAALRLCDGAMILVDAVEGICPQTYIVMKQCWEDRVKTVLVINKIDRLITELNLSPLEAYQVLTSVIESANAIIGGFLVAEKVNVQEEVKEEEEVGLYFSPDLGNVAFSSAVHRWAFSPSQFSEFYAKKLGVNSQVLTKCLWGEFYFNPKSKKV
jgi:ribosome assembly protein 1